MKTTTPGTVIVTIDGVDYLTIVDSDGTQRFQKNRIMCFLYDFKNVDLILLWKMVDHDLLTLAELMEFYRNIGYSINGFADIFDKCEIINPLWDD